MQFITVDIDRLEEVKEIFDFRGIEYEEDGVCGLIVADEDYYPACHALEEYNVDYLEEE